MKYLINIIFILPIVIFSQTNPFKDLKYDKVVAYEFEGSGEQMIKILLNSDPDKISKSAVLSKDQINQIELALTSKTSYGNRTMSCFDPHFALVYYKKEKIVATIDVCLQCNSLRSTLEIPATTLSYTQLTEDYAVPNEGFSKEARKKIHDFCKQLGFTSYLKPLDSFYDN